MDFAYEKNTELDQILDNTARFTDTRQHQHQRQLEQRPHFFPVKFVFVSNLSVVIIILGIEVEKVVQFYNFYNFCNFIACGLKWFGYYISCCGLKCQV